MIGDSFSSDAIADESFVSITNHINEINEEDNTLIDFRKKIEQNKRYIKQEI